MLQQSENINMLANDFETCPRCGGHNVDLQYDNTYFCRDCDWITGDSVKEFWCPECQALTMEYADHRIWCSKCGCTVDLDCIGVEACTDIHGRWKIRELKAAKVQPGTRKIDCAFSEVSVLEKIELPEGLEEIGQNAFAGCFKLRQIQIPDSVRILGEFAFDSCAFSTINLPEGITEIPIGLFADCKNLKGVVLPGSLTSIGDVAFRGCESLEEIEIPEEVRSIGSYAFGECSGLRRVILPAHEMNIGRNAFPMETQLIIRE